MEQYGIRETLRVRGGVVKTRLLRRDYLTLVVTWPGKVMVMTPPHVHMHLDVAVSAGVLPMRTVGDPGAHGADVTGIQG